MSFGRAIFIDQITKNGRDVIFENELPLIHALEQPAAQTVNRLALLIHYVVVFEEMFAGFEMLCLDCLLRRLDAARDELRLNRNTLFHAQALK